jgi:hypothetical protein
MQLFHLGIFYQKLHEEGLNDVFHLRYNAAHRGAETEIFPYMKGENCSGLVSFAATHWRKLLNPKKMRKLGDFLYGRK